MRARVRAWACLQVPVQAVAALRRQPGPAPRELLPGGPLAPAFLKHADEQTVVGVAAVLRAAHEHAVGGPFTDWGVVGAPRFPGRAAMAHTLERFREEGAWGVSPHMIPHRSLHSLPGTLSQALKVHGPNFGAGGGPGCEADAILTGCALLHGSDLPGVWVVLTRVEPELTPEPTGQPSSGACVHALALALTPDSEKETGRQGEGQGPTISLSPCLPVSLSACLPDTPPFSLDVLLDLLRHSATAGEGCLGAPLCGGMWLQLHAAGPSFAGGVTEPTWTSSRRSA